MREGKGGLEERARAKGKREKVGVRARGSSAVESSQKIRVGWTLEILLRMS